MMGALIDNPFAVFAIAVIAQWGAAFIGDLLRRSFRPLKKDERDDFDTVLTRHSDATGADHWF
jgi:hypothetical protein